MPPQGSLALGLWTMMGRPTSPTPESVTPAPGGPPPQHLGRQRAEMGLAGRHTPVPREARPDGRGGGAGAQERGCTHREAAQKESKMIVS